MNSSIAIAIICISSILVGYLCGSILWSVILGKIFHQKDARDFGSHGAGATNSMRVYGKKTAVIILFLDVLKCYIPTMAIWLIVRYCLSDYLIVTEAFNPYTLVYLTSFFAIVGHCFPIFFKFKGGKGAACYGALCLCLSPFLGITALSIFILVIIFTKYVSLGSIIASCLALVLLFIPGINWYYMLNTNISTLYAVNGYGLYWILFLLFILTLSTLLLLWQHRTNIQRLIKHEEHKSFTSKK